MEVGNLDKESVARTFAALEAIPRDAWILNIASILEPMDVVQMRAVSQSWKLLMTDDEVWLNKITVLSFQYSGSLHVDQGGEESVFHWYSRCVRILRSGAALARRHFRGESPYLELYGVVGRSTFTPFAGLCFPIEYGTIVELIRLLSRAGSRDPAYDATLRFEGIPLGLSVDGMFRHILKVVHDASRNARESDLRHLPEVLRRVYSPQSDIQFASGGGVRAGKRPVAESVPTGPTGPTVPEAGRARLKLRLKRMSNELMRAHARISELETENARLRAENTELRAQNFELRAENARLTGTKRRLEDALESLEGEKVRSADSAQKELDEVRGQLAAQRRARSVLQRQVDAMKADLERVRQVLSAAERHYEKAEATLERERGRVDDARKGERAARLREAEVERDAAAQVAAAQRAATETIEAELETRSNERGLMTARQFVDYSAMEAAVGIISPSFRQVAAHVMAAECSAAADTVTLPSLGDSRGRGVTYMRVVRALKPSDKLSRAQLWERTQMLKASLEHVSGGGGEASIAQLSHFIRSEKELVRKALQGTWLSPPKPIDLEAQIALRSEMSGAMYDAVLSFIRRKTGIKAEGTRKEVKAAFDDFKFEYETGKFTSVDDKEVEVDGRTRSRSASQSTVTICESRTPSRSCSNVLRFMQRRVGSHGPHVSPLMSTRSA